MRTIAVWLALFAAPFWETKAPRDWTDAEIKRLLADSPWAQNVEGAQVFLATARPIREAESEMMRRKKDKDSQPDPDYNDFLAQDQGKSIVLAVAYPDTRALAEATETKRMEDECILRVGKRKSRMTGHFPPTPSDPYLRLVFPRQVGPGDKSLVFELYLPGMPQGYRIVEFRLKELGYKGAPEM